MLQRITEAVEAIRDMNRQIATAAEEQTAVAEDISRNLTEITSIATTNQQNVERTETASQNLRPVGAATEVTRRLAGDDQRGGSTVCRPPAFQQSCALSPLYLPPIRG